jgi:DNA segregation ATPase FtsK/SpoIIIE-like protein
MLGMDADEEKSLRMQVEELADSIRALSEKQDSQYTDVMLRLDELKADKERLDLVVGDAAQYMDTLYEDAKHVVIKAGKASTSYLQRKLNIGYERAGMLMDRLEQDFIVGEADGAKPREVLVKSTAELDQGMSPPEAVNENEDELYGKAKQLALEVGKISTSYIQRKLGTGYARAARLMDMLEEAGVVEPAKAGKPSKVLHAK